MFLNILQVLTYYTYSFSRLMYGMMALGIRTNSCLQLKLTQFFNEIIDNTHKID